MWSLGCGETVHGSGAICMLWNIFMLWTWISLFFVSFQLTLAHFRPIYSKYPQLFRLFIRISAQYFLISFLRKIEE